MTNLRVDVRPCSSPGPVIEYGLPGPGGQGPVPMFSRTGGGLIMDKGQGKENYAVLLIHLCYIFFVLGLLFFK